MKIEINKELDKEVYLDFHNAVIGGADFGKKIKDTHSEITEENYVEYIDKYYKEYEKELSHSLDEAKKCFLDVETILFNQLSEYFKQKPNFENVTCYLSIFNCNPRYIETKTFQVFYRKPYNMKKEVIVHELTHFSFYDFCYKLGLKDSKELWELSEIFNVIFLNLEPIRSAIGTEELLFYPELKEKLEAINLIWNKDLEPKDFVLSSLEYLKQKTI